MFMTVCHLPGFDTFLKVRVVLRNTGVGRTLRGHRQGQDLDIQVQTFRESNQAQHAKDVNLLLYGGEPWGTEWSKPLSKPAAHLSQEVNCVQCLNSWLSRVTVADHLQFDLPGFTRGCLWEVQGAYLQTNTLVMLRGRQQVQCLRRFFNTLMHWDRQTKPHKQPAGSCHAWLQQLI